METQQKRTWRARFVQGITFLVTQTLLFFVMAWLLPGLIVTTVSAAVLAVIGLTAANIIGWWIFIQVGAHLPALLYPIITFGISALFVLFIDRLLPGISVNGFVAAISVAIVFGFTNVIVGLILSLDEDSLFDRYIIKNMVQKYGKAEKTTEPGFMFLEIDGLSKPILERALNEGHMPTLKRWLDSGSHKLLQWETDLSSQTAAMQTGILQGNNHEVPAYRWWDRERGKIVMSGNPRDAQAIEERVTNHKGLCADGGASRGNMFSGDASESLFTFSTLLDRSRGSAKGFYLFLVSPYVVSRLVARFFIEVATEWIDAFKQRRRKDKFQTSARNPAYAFMRAAMDSTLPDLSTYVTISDLLRGLPAVYTLFAGYDDLGHFAGIDVPEAFESLAKTDQHFARIERALQFAPRPYHIVVLSDHGQSVGPTFKTAHGKSLEELVKSLVAGNPQVLAELDTNEAWDNINAVLTDSMNAETRTGQVMRTMLASRTRNGTVAMGPDRETAEREHEKEKARSAKVVVLASGSLGLIYFGESKKRLTFEEIQAAHPELLLGLAKHPGIGYVLVDSEKQGAMVLGANGINFIEQGVVENKDPLALYGPNAVRHILREHKFSNCPDIIVNSMLDPQTQQLAGFENQVGHHGGLGGWQNCPFVMYPASLPYDGKPIVGAAGVYHLLRGWREEAQPNASTAAKPILI